MEKGLKSLSGSGGGFKVAAEYAAAKVLIEEEGYEPDVFVGTSAFATLVVPLALGLFEELDKAMLNFSMEMAFDERISNKKNGKLKKGLFLKRLLKRKNSIGEMNALKETISKVVTEELFAAYKTGEDYSPCYICFVGRTTRKKHYVCVKDLTYEQYLDTVVASSSIPGITKPIYIDYVGEYCYDGGLRDSIGSVYLFNKFKHRIVQNISIYSRPKEIAMNLTAEELQTFSKEDVNIIEAGGWAIETLMLEVSKSDEENESREAIIQGIDNTQIFIPEVLRNFYDDDADRIVKSFYVAKEATKNQIKDKL